MKRWLCGTLAVTLTLTAAVPALAVTVTDATGSPVEVTDASRIVAVGSAVTEALFALGEGQRVIAVDSTSQWPEAARKLPQVGYQRTLGAEGILALSPTLLIGTTQAGPPAVLDKLRAAGLTVLILPTGPGVEDALQSLQAIGQVTDEMPASTALVSEIRNRLARLEAATPPHEPGVLFILSAAGGTPLAAGRNSNADSLIQLAGGRNVIDSYEGYRPLSAEAVVKLAPEVIVVPEHVMQEVGGMSRLLALPGIAATPAGQSQRIIVMDGAFLLGMGPRLAEAAESLARELHGVRLSQR